MKIRTICRLCVVFLLTNVAVAGPGFIIDGHRMSEVVKIGGVLDIDTVTALPATFTVGDSGAQTLTYDFSALTFTQGSKETYVDPQSVIPLAPFANAATVAFADTYPVLGAGTTYYLLDVNGLRKLGFFKAGDTVDFAQQPLQIFPMHPDTSWQSSVDVIAKTGLIHPQHISYVQKSSCDAFGILKTPRGTFGCLRVKSENTITIQPNPPLQLQPTTTNNVTFTFYTTNDESVEITCDSADVNNPTVTPRKIMYRHPDGAPLGIAANTPTPDGLSMLNAFPNPASSQSTFAYTLAERSAVTAELVNVVGQRVALIASGVQASGPHFAGINVANLSAGSYMLRLTANGKTTVQPMVVVK